MLRSSNTASEVTPGTRVENASAAAIVKPPEASMLKPKSAPVPRAGPATNYGPDQHTEQDLDHGHRGKADEHEHGGRQLEIDVRARQQRDRQQHRFSVGVSIALISRR